MRWIIFALVAALISIGLAIILIVNEERNFNNKIYPNVYINEVDFGRKSKSAVRNYFNNLNSQFKKVRIDILYKDESIATFSGEQLKIGYDSQGIADRAYLIGRSTHFTSRLYQKLATLLAWQEFNFTVDINYEKSLIQDFLSGVKEKYDKPAKNALFSFENGRVVSFSQEEKGQEVEEQKFIYDIDKLVRGLENKVNNIQVTLPIKVIEPKVTLAKANEFGIEELIAEGKSDFSHSIPERIHNIILASSKFNGVLIPKGSVFSFNDTVGDISSLTGYKPAYIIKSGKTVLGDGGGVCQVSTTLFRAALNAGLPILERTAHAYRVGYYENDSKPGFDATVFAPNPDLKIKNDSPASILIQTEVDQVNNLLYFRFYGKKDQRKIEISQVTVYDVVPPLPEIRQDDPTLKKGVIKQVDFPAWGAKAVFNYKVSNDDKVLFEKKFFSNYRPWQAVYLVGQAD
ncbi:hypothetical protein A3A46_04240 [Candidatus Roizmanbacteria bacterium RIFCSPLOWO2_01_FULL_37_13]|uniref:YoaR-like putative peptidoglycan binding domain-containing protein n=1 Tax=Candidatus Roizmanbacteria bacterium RIFCSPHIGHO2_02_FULL_38_11 TaxID=1802039 RepID=A0A1F7H0Z5_9BACT|nr:MAG: hypothetical protein A3C25_03195 [Candidatus Roizmanbacteria bacterium RIFCSPHIGHO2_02_FULL_38_11]OGK40984.1 MAG: hypothetical protein A3A46_04240 [Candidatus Roizmanbacteria bacterium RIFCSPLOWO2_01_FULL_37_13]